MWYNSRAKCGTGIAAVAVINSGVQGQEIYAKLFHKSGQLSLSVRMHFEFFQRTLVSPGDDWSLEH